LPQQLGIDYWVIDCSPWGKDTHLGALFAKLSVVVATFFLPMRTRLICPACNSTQVKKIVYGFPDVENFDFDKFEVGGCCVTGRDPLYKCTNCESSW
jgi:hypothetical protein